MPKGPDTPKGPEQPQRINWNEIIIEVWGIILPFISRRIKARSAEFSERFLPEETKEIVASLISYLAGKIEKHFKGAIPEIISDILEHLAGGAIEPVEKKKRAKPEEMRGRYEWPRLEELKAAATSKEPAVKRRLLLTWTSPNLHDVINQFTDEEIDDLINVLINLEESRRELAKFGIQIELKEVWEMMRSIFESFEKLASQLGIRATEVTKFIGENKEQILKAIDTHAARFASELNTRITQQTRRYRLI